MIPQETANLYVWRIVVFTVDGRTQWVPTFVLEPQEWLTLQTRDGETHNTWVASLLGAGFGLVVDPNLGRIAQDAPRVASTAATMDVARDGTARIGGTLPDAVWKVTVDAPIDAHDPETAAIRRLLAARRDILMITGTGLQINESTWALEGLNDAVNAGTVAAGWVPLSARPLH
ncbi:hypothetical protein [Microbacterium sp.]|uniref:hypothetical protein n=1 Tax=Microbacterium sp. TaxID=51671 RepID=UPI003F99DA8A